MTTKEAILCLETNKELNANIADAYDMAIEALEKQIPKRPIKKNPVCYAKSTDGEECYAYDYHCPACNVKLKSTEHHCHCGQALIN